MMLELFFSLIQSFFPAAVAGSCEQFEFFGAILNYFIFIQIKLLLFVFTTLFGDSLICSLIFCYHYLIAVIHFNFHTSQYIFYKNIFLKLISNPFMCHFTRNHKFFTFKILFSLTIF
jgi:hypothetical protein